MLLEIRDATIADAEVLAPRLRDADVMEVRRSSGFAPLEALVRSFKASEGRAHTLLFDGQPVAMYGIVRVAATSIAVPWLLTTDEVERHPVAFFKVMKATVEGWADAFPTLVQFVDVEHTTARRFLSALGFTIYPTVPHGVERAPFHPAVRSK